VLPRWGRAATGHATYALASTGGGFAVNGPAARCSVDQDPALSSAQGPRPVFVGAGEGIRASAEHTAHALGLVETVVPPGHSTPLHIHGDQDEAFHVLAGAVDLCGDERFRAEAGACLHAAGVPHTFLGIGDEPARVLVMFLPGGLEEAFAAPDRFDEILRARNVEIVGPPLSA
jgi:quercetin dioxygenase-like cupin family protein